MNHFVAKKALLGLCPALILVVLACQAPLLKSGGTASMQIGLQLASTPAGSQPTAAERAVFGALVQARSGADSRLLHPDTRYISVSVSGAGLATPLTQSKTIAAGENSVAMTINGLSANASYTITVNAFDGPAGGLLASATATVTLQSGANQVPLGMVPVHTVAASAGPDAFSWTVGAAAFQVYKFHIPVATGYTCKALLNGSTPVAVEGLFGPDGRRVAGFINLPGDVAWGSFVAPAVGDYYVALSGKPGDTVSVTLDIPFIFTLTGEIQVMDAIHIRDCKLPVIVDCSVPLTSAAPSASMWKAGTTAAVAGSRLTIANPAGFDAQAGTAATSANCQVVDGVIGAVRTLSIPLGTFKNFAYVASTGLPTNTGAFGQPFDTLYKGISALNTGSDNLGAVVVAGASISESAVATMNKNMIMVGGCTPGADAWTRADTNERSVVNYQGGNYLYLGPGTPTGSLVSGLNFFRPTSMATSPNPLLYVSGCNPVFHACNMVISGYSLSGNSETASVITADGASVPTFRSCRVVMGAVNLTSGTVTSASIRCIKAANGLVLVSTVVSTWTLSATVAPTSGTYEVIGLDGGASAAGNFTIVNSTISAGRITFGDTTGIFTYCLSAKFYTGLANTALYNSVFLVDTLGTYDFARSIWGNELALFSAFSNCSVTDMPIVMSILGTDIGPGDLNNANRADNVCNSNASMNFVNFTNGDYHLSAASPAAVRGGGLDLSGTTLSAAIKNAALYDCDRKSRLADGRMSIGAYEY